MDAPAGMPGMMHHDPAGRLNAHAAALQPPTFHVAPQEISPQAHAPQAPDVSNWAADFSRFAGQQQPQQQRRGPLQSHAAAPMQMNFQSAFPQHQQQQQGPAAFSSFFAPAGAAYGGQAVQPPAGEADFDQEMARWMAANGAAAGNMDQVDAAMDQMARELELNDAALAEAEAASLADAAQTNTQTPAPASDTAHFSDLNVPELGNLSLENRELPLEQQPAAIQTLEEDAAAAEAARNKSAVSEAAERLLESVQHESGEKWQNSVFLSLMRDFRDGRKDIIDNEIQQLEDEVPMGNSDPSASSSHNAEPAT